MGAGLAVSNPCFELGLYLHYEEWAEGRVSSGEIEKELRALQGARPRIEHWYFTTTESATILAYYHQIALLFSSNPHEFCTIARTHTGIGFVAF